MKKLKLMMMMTLMMCLVGMTSYSQVNETDIFVNKQEVKTINFKLEKSSEYLIKSSSCGISQEVLLIICGVIIFVIIGIGISVLVLKIISEKKRKKKPNYNGSSPIKEGRTKSNQKTGLRSKRMDILSFR